MQKKMRKKINKIFILFDIVTIEDVLVNPA